MKDTDFATLQQWVDESENIVFFGGAGVSTESGIPDFRGETGLYNQPSATSPETILSLLYFFNHPEEFFQFYKEKMLPLHAKPNAAHYKLAELERAGKLRAIVTQNIDGLHEAAGSREVLELHGSIRKNYCIRCLRQYPVSLVAESDGVPRCPVCGGIVRPDIVLYQETLEDDVIARAADQIGKADLFLVGGTSLTVYPAAAFLNYYVGHRLVFLNKTPTTLDYRANLIFREPIGEVLGRLRVSPAPPA